MNFMGRLTGVAGDGRVGRKDVSNLPRKVLSLTIIDSDGDGCKACATAGDVADLGARRECYACGYNNQ